VSHSESGELRFAMTSRDQILNGTTTTTVWKLGWMKGDALELINDLAVNLPAPMWEENNLGSKRQKPFELQFRRLTN